VNAVCVLALNMINDKVFLILWWWLLVLIIAGFSRLIFRLFQSGSAIVRYQMINLRMNRYFRRSAKILKIEEYIKQCKMGDWFVLYQLSKNLNRPFFMEFLTKLSVEYNLDLNKDDTPLMGGSILVESKYQNDKMLGQMHRILYHPELNGKAPLCEEEDTGDTFLEMFLQPAVMDDVDGRDSKKEKEETEEDEEEEEEQDEKRRRKSSKGSSKSKKKPEDTPTHAKEV